MDKKKEKLVLENMNLAYSIAHKYADKVKSVYELDDAKQVCLEALIIAANTFDETKGTSFSTYAYTVIHNELVTRVIIESRKRNNTIVVSLDAPLKEDDESFSLMSTLSDNNSLDDHIIQSDNIDTLYKYIDELEEPYRQIMYLKCKGYSLVQISKQLNRSDKTINTHYKNGLNMLRVKYRRDKNKYGE